MYKLGFDIGGTNIAYGILDESFNILFKGSSPFPRDPFGEPKAAKYVASYLRQLSDELCAAYSVPYERIELIGICIPGSIDKTGQTVINAHNLGFHNVKFKQLVEQAFGKRVLLKNDADSAAIAEHRMGALKGASCGALVTLGTGVGGGIIINDRLFHGGMGNGIELGHMRLDNNGEECTCGQRGCVETLCSATWLTNQARELLDRGNTALQGFSNCIDARALIECAKLGDAECMKVWNTYLINLSDALASIINIIDPEVIAIGGGLSNAGEFLIEPLSRMAVERCFFDDAARIVKAKLGNDAGLLGAVMDEASE
ncbi:MAG: ROK family protein [Christensenellaceae bacterium]|nr:ROK family protein [Christensenellaceae bacterium]